MTVAPKFEDFQKYSKQQMDAVDSAAATWTKALQDIAAETTEYSKKTIAANTAVIEKLLGAKSVEGAIEIQSAFVKGAYDDFVVEATKLNEMCAKLAAEAFKPVETVFAAFQAM
ncbi:MAG: phasin family protein [Roseiarcus sp.]